MNASEVWRQFSRRVVGQPSSAKRSIASSRKRASQGRSAPGRAAALSMLDVDPAGLDVMDRKLLAAVLEKFGGGPVGLDNVAAAIGESTDTIEDVIEPYLIQQGYLQRTPRGRMATALAWTHFGFVPPERV